MKPRRPVNRVVTGWVYNFDDPDLDEVVRKMFEAAKKVRLNAQAPFSRFWVGVAVLSEKTGNIYLGCNVERASWTQTTHAEQNAVDSMVAAEGSGSKLSKLVLLAGPAHDDIVIPPQVAESRKLPELKFNEIPVPCGHCLQCIWENCLEDGGVELYGLLPTGEISMITIENAFPLRFGPADLGVKY